MAGLIAPSVHPVLHFPALAVHRYGLTGHVFGPANAYTSLALFNLLRMPLAFLPIMITSCINALVALTRIKEFLEKPESGLEALHKAADGTPAGHVKVGQYGIRLKRGCLHAGGAICVRLGGCLVMWW